MAVYACFYWWGRRTSTYLSSMMTLLLGVMMANFIISAVYAVEFIENGGLNNLIVTMVCFIAGLFLVVTRTIAI